MRILSAMLLSLPACLATLAQAEDAEVVVFNQAVIRYDADGPEDMETDGYVVRNPGHTIERTLDLPAAPATQRDARRIVATVHAEPVFSELDGRRRPNDPWTRLGCVTLLPAGPDAEDVPQVELIRFITGYGAPGTFQQDVTALAPFLHGRQTFRLAITSYSEQPGWRITLSLSYTAEGVGQRRPMYARQIFGDAQVTAEQPRLVANVTIPAEMDLPRLRILSTGHATDGRAENEFVSCTHVLRVDGVEIARWRPWSERGGPLRDRNPWAGRRTVEGREVRASDFDRSGWNPGLVVEPLIIPVPELTPGRHEVQIEILGIRPKQAPDADDKEHFGYWRVSAIVVADEPWPEKGG